MNIQYKKDDVEARLKSGERLKHIADSIGCSYQLLQYHRNKWGGDPLPPYMRKGKDHPLWKGGVSIDRQGYRLIYSPERKKVFPYTYEHVLVAERMIGRRLRKGEHVHHLNGDKLDNRPENLYVCGSSKHRILHRSLECLAYELVKHGKIIFDNGAYRWS